MTDEQASELVSDKFSRVMNATTSRFGMVGDPPVVALVTAVALIAYLAARRMDAAPIVQHVLIGLLALPVAIALIIAVALIGARKRVVAWLAGLPFPVENMNAILNGLGDCLEVTFRESVPDTKELNEKLDAINPDCFVTESKEQIVVMRIGVVDNKRNPAASNYRRYARVVQLVETLLVPLSAKSPIAVVRVQ